MNKRFGTGKSPRANLQRGLLSLVFCWGLVLAAPVLADAAAGMRKCQGIGDLEVRLACFDAVGKVVKGRKKDLSALDLEVRACRKGPDLKRLSCFDAVDIDAAKVAASADAAKAAASARVAGATYKDEPIRVTRKEKKRARKAAEKEAKRLANEGYAAVVTQVDKMAYGVLQVRLDNDEIWRELAFAQTTSYKVGDSIKIVGGSLGSNRLVNMRTGVGTKVKRIR